MFNFKVVYLFILPLFGLFIQLKLGENMAERDNCLNFVHTALSAIKVIT